MKGEVCLIEYDIPRSKELMRVQIIKKKTLHTIGITEKDSFPCTVVKLCSIGM